MSVAAISLRLLKQLTSVSVLKVMTSSTSEIAVVVAGEDVEASTSRAARALAQDGDAGRQLPVGSDRVSGDGSTTIRLRGQSGHLYNIPIQS